MQSNKLINEWKKGILANPFFLPKHKFIINPAIMMRNRKYIINAKINININYFYYHHHHIVL